MIRRHYPARPVEPHEYAAWRAVLDRAERNGWYEGAADRAEPSGEDATRRDQSATGRAAYLMRLRYAADGWHAWRADGAA